MRTTDHLFDDDDEEEEVMMTSDDDDDLEPMTMMMRLFEASTLKMQLIFTLPPSPVAGYTPPSRPSELPVESCSRSPSL